MLKLLNKYHAGIAGVYAFPKASW